MYPNLFYRYQDNIKSLSYNSDEGNVMEEIKTWTVHGRDPITSSMEIALSSATSIPGTFTVVTISLNENSIEKYKRSYPKLQTVAASIGGIVKFIMTISEFIVIYITSQMLHVELSNVCISNDEPQLQKMKKKKTDPIRLSQNSPTRSFKLKTEQPTLTNSNEKKASLSFTEAALLSCCVKKQSVKHKIHSFSSIIKSKISTDYFLTHFNDFENLKTLLLDSNLKSKFLYMRKPTLSEHLEKVKDPNFTNFDTLTLRDETESPRPTQPLKKKEKTKK
jgi:hypothetical protein